MIDNQAQLSPDRLRTFVATAQTLNFTHAARQVYLSQSAVSMQIHHLEEDLGKKLFRRITRGVELTPAGEALLKYAKRLLLLHDEALSAIAEPELDGLIRLGAAEDHASQHLPRILRRFRIWYPLVRVDLYCDISSTLLKMLGRNEIDLCLCNGETRDHGGTFLRNEPVVWIAPKDSEPEKESPLPLALFHQGCIYRKWAMQAMDEQNIPYRIAYSSPSVAGILAAVKAGNAVAPMGASVPLTGFRIISGKVLNPLPAAVVSLHQSDKPANKPLSSLSRYIAEEFRSMTVQLPPPLQRPAAVGDELVGSTQAPP